MKNVRCCDCGWLLPKTRECTAPVPFWFRDPASERYLTALVCLEPRTCDAFEPDPSAKKEDVHA